MNRLIRLLLCFSLVLGFLPFNLKAANSALFIDRVLKNAQKNNPDIYKNFISDKNFKSAFCGISFLSINETNHQCSPSLTEKTNWTPDFITLASLKDKSNSSSTLFPSSYGAAFQPPAFDVLIPPPRQI